MARILIVEDDDILSDMLIAKLRADGHALALVEDGGEAVAKIAVFQPDLVLLDCALPTLSGANVIGAMKESLGDADIPVVLMSARSSEDYIHDMLLQGAAAFLVKPLNMRRLAETIDHQLALRQERKAA